jgi:hypothetical protein
MLPLVNKQAAENSGLGPGRNWFLESPDPARDPVAHKGCI